MTLRACHLAWTVQCEETNACYHQACQDLSSSLAVLPYRAEALISRLWLLRICLPFALAAIFEFWGCCKTQRCDLLLHHVLVYGPRMPQRLLSCNACKLTAVWLSTVAPLRV